eukprot:1256262-Pyramimonas_sp.AAC.1
MSAGRGGRIPPTHIVQLIGILPSHDCRCNRVGQIWANPLYLRDSNRPYHGGNISTGKMYGYRNDASCLKYWFTQKTSYKLKCPDPTPLQEVEFAAMLMVQDAYHAGAPAGGSDV